MPSNIPRRTLSVYMAGAGLSAAFGLSNTAALLSTLTEFSRTAAGKWLADSEIERRLTDSYGFFYPDASHPGFRPDPVDYFSALRAFIDVGSTFTGTGFDDAEPFYRVLKRGIAHVLISQIRATPDDKLVQHEYLREIVQPGHVIITSNWDTLLERYAALNQIPLRLTTSSREFSVQEVTVLKLHGSIDWCKVRDRVSGQGDDQYASLTERQQPTRPHRTALPSGDHDLLRIRSGLGDGWQKLKSRSKDQWMVTMVTGKSDDLGPLQNIWRDAYRALSRASRLEIVGYSMPPDDVEIRTLLRAGIQRGNSPRVVVRNPSPDVHLRIRAYLDRLSESIYQPV